MYLEKVAQKIVDMMMKVIDNRNINIMDLNGYIIASGEKKRIDTYHKGAANVIETRKRNIIYPEEVNNFPGAKEGVNMPIIIEGKMVGVVGVYGHPDDVKMIAKLVKSSVELSIEQHLLTEQIKYIRDLKQQLVRILIFDNLVEREEEVLCLSKFMNIDINSKVYAIVIGLKEYGKMDAINRLDASNYIEKMLLQKSCIEDKELSGQINEHYVLFKTQSKKNREFYHHICSDINKDSKYQVQIAISSYQWGMDGYKKAYFEGVSLLKSHKHTLLTMDDYSLQLEYLLQEIDQEKINHFLEPIYQSLLDQEGQEISWLEEVLKALFDNNLNIKNAADTLYIHKNTLIYRIKKIQQITGLSTYNYDHAMILKMLLLYIKNKKRRSK